MPSRARGLRGNFYPRPPRGGRRSKTISRSSVVNFYPRPPRGGRLSAVRDAIREEQISIHALREEGDRPEISTTITLVNFYPRPPRGGRLGYAASLSLSARFLSTPSARRATQQLHQFFVCHGISIHAHREEGDRLKVKAGTCQRDFYPRPPRGGRLCIPAGFFQHRKISIHALREEGDIRWPCRGY